MHPTLELWLLGDLNNECTEGSWVSLMNGLFKIIFHLKLSYWLNALSSGRPEQWICTGNLSVANLKLSPGRPEKSTYNLALPSVTDEWPFQNHVSYWNNSLSPKGLEMHVQRLLQCPWLEAYSPGRPEKGLLQKQVFSSVTNEWSFQDHLLIKTTISTWSSVSQGTWIMKMQKLSVCYWLGRSVPPVSLKVAFSRPSFVLNQSSVSWQAWTMNVQRLPQSHWHMAFLRPSFK